MWGHIQRRNAIDILTLDPQEFPACREHGRIRAHAHQGFRESRRCLSEVLAIVEHEQQFLATDGPGDRFGGNHGAADLQPQDGHDRGRHQRGVGQGSQFDQPAVALKCRKQAARHLQRQCLGEAVHACLRG